MNILVTGGNGYIGAETVRMLEARKHKVYPLDNFSSGSVIRIDSYNFFAEDIRGLTTERILAGCKIDAVIHLAALASVPSSIDRPTEYYDVNVYGTLNLLKAVLKTGVKRVVFASTGAINSNTPYGHTKLAGEHMIQDMLGSYAILRYFNVAGGNDHSTEHVLPHIAKATACKPFKICGSSYSTRDGTCERDYVYVKDVALANCLAVESDSVGVYEVGTGVGTTVLELVEACATTWGRPVVTEYTNCRPGDPTSLVANQSQRLPGWSPQYSLEDIIRSVQ